MLYYHLYLIPSRFFRVRVSVFRLYRIDIVMTTPFMGSRNDAALAGFRMYATEVPCRNGHIAPRRTDSGACTECLKAYIKVRRATLDVAYNARREGLDVFMYSLHPDDMAQALAFCQALDLQRGRTPRAAGVPLPAIPPSRTPEQIAQDRARIFGALAPNAPRHEFKP